MIELRISLTAIAILVLATLADARVATSSEPSASDIREAYESIRNLVNISFRDDVTSWQRSQAVAGQFDSLRLVEFNLANIDDNDLLYHFQATALAASYAPYRNDIVGSLVNSLNEIQRRDIDTDEMVQRVFRVLVNARDFDTANVLRGDYPQMNLPYLPSLSKSVAINDGVKDVPILRPNSTRRELVRDHIDIASEMVIIVIANDHCRWFAEAMNALGQDPMLREVLKKHAMLLIPQTSTPHPERLFELGDDVWIDFALMDQWTDWPAIVQTGSPSFYVFSEGDLVEMFVGWGGDEVLEWLSTVISQTLFDG